MDDVQGLRDTIVPKSDQLNADDLITGPLMVTITAVRRGNAEQPVVVELDGQRPYKPCKGMRRVLIEAWGDDGRAWVRRSMTLYRNPDVKYGGVKVGGVEISHLSHIDSELEIAVTVSRGKRKIHHVKPLVQEAPRSATRTGNPDAEYLRSHPDQETMKALRREMFGTGKLTPADIAKLAAAMRSKEPPREPGDDSDENPFE